MRPSHFIPKSSPRQLADTFSRYCLDGPRDPSKLEAVLRNSDYIRFPSRSKLARAFVVDDKRPAVAVSGNGRICAVWAESRTGQTERLRRLVRERFPNAVPYSPGELARHNLEEAWHVPQVGNFELSREGAPSTPSSLSFEIRRSTQ